MDNHLNKSLAALDAAADELLKKSTTDDTTGINPDETPQGNMDKSLKPDSPDGDNDIKKSDGDDSNSTDVANDEDKDDDDQDDDADAQKSLADIQQAITDDFHRDEDIAKGIATSEFQAALVAATAKSLGELQYDLHSNRATSDQVATVMAKSLQAVMAANQQLRVDNDKLTRRLNKLEKSLDKGIGDILDAIDSLSTQPAHMRKSVSSINVHDRDFNKSIGGTSNGGFESLSKGQVMTILTNELYSNNPQVRPEDIISYESGAPLRDDLKTLVVSKCK